MLRAPPGYDLVIVGPGARRQALLNSFLSRMRCLRRLRFASAEDEKDLPLLHAEYSTSARGAAAAMAGSDALILVSSEALRRVEAVGRAQRAERLALEASATPLSAATCSKCARASTTR